MSVVVDDVGVEENGVSRPGGKLLARKSSMGTHRNRRPGRIAAAAAFR